MQFRFNPILASVVSLFLVLVHAQSSPPSSSVTSTSSSSGLNSSSSDASPTNTADFPSLSGYSPCVTNCLSVAVSNRGCISVTEVGCYCNQTSAVLFEQDIISCAQSGCPTELGTAENLAQRFCMVGNSSTSISFPPITSSASSSSLPLSSSPSTSLSLLSSSPSSSSNSAINTHSDIHGIASTVVICLGVSLVTVLVGAFSV